MKKLLLLVRWIVGLLFIFSGLIKANDPLGLSYKMQEFFSVWHLSSLNDATLTLSIVMNVFEVLAGVAVIIGWRMKLFSWLLLLLILFFSFLTGYAAYSGKIKTCGCFGDCLPLTPIASFGKDIFLFVLILLLFIYRNKIHSVWESPAPQVVLFFTIVLITTLQFFVLRHLPMIDCLPYKAGNNLLEEMKVPPGAVRDSTVITFQYKKEGKVVEFSADNFPADFDSTYEFVDRTDKVVRKGNATPAIVDFSLQDSTGNDVTQEILSQQGHYILLFAKDLSTYLDWNNDAFQKILNKSISLKMPFYIVTADSKNAMNIFGKTPGINILQCDGIVIKTAARVLPTFFIMQGATVQHKIGGYDLNEVIKIMAGLPANP